MTITEAATQSAELTVEDRLTHHIAEPLTFNALTDTLQAQILDSDHLKPALNWLLGRDITSFTSALPAIEWYDADEGHFKLVEVWDVNGIDGIERGDIIITDKFVDCAWFTPSGKHVKHHAEPAPSIIFHLVLVKADDVASVRRPTSDDVSNGALTDVKQPQIKTANQQLVERLDKLIDLLKLR